MQNTHQQKGIAALAVVITLAVIAAVAGGAYLKLQKSAKVSVTPSESVTGGYGEESASGSSVNMTATTDVDLDADSAALDAKIKALDSDSVNIDAGINDQQGNLSEE